MKARAKSKSPLVVKTTNSKCGGCPLRKGKSGKIVNTFVYGEGKPDIFFIGEAPGYHEAIKGEPFVGLSGGVLRRLVLSLQKQYGRTIALGNVCRCRPTTAKGGDRQPTTAEMESCRGFIYRDLERLKPKIVVLLGRTPLQALAIDPRTNRPFTEETAKIMVHRGVDLLVRTPKGLEFPTVATLHPAALLRNPAIGGVFEEDIRKVFLRFEKDYPDYSKRGKPTVILDTVPKVKKYLQKLSKLGPKDILALDYETEDLSKLGVRLLTVGFASGPNKAYVIPYRHKESPWTGKEFKRVKKLLTRFFQTYKCTLVAHNLKFELNVTQDVFGVSLHNRIVECTMLRAQILNENRGSLKDAGFGLKNLVEEWLQFYHYHDPDIAPIVALRNRGRLAKAPLNGLAEYNGMDCYVEWRLYHYESWFAKKLHGKGYYKRYRRYSRKLSGPASVFATQLERHGIAVNKKQLRYFMSPESPILIRMQELEDELKDMDSAQEANSRLLKAKGTVGDMQPLLGEDSAPWLFSLSRARHRQVLYLDVLGLKPVSYTAKKNPQINDVFYEAHKGVPEVDIMAEWAKYFKLMSTYIEGIYARLQNDPDMRDGRVRGNLNLHKTVTGRTSFSNPNMQNIPRGKDEEAKAIKRMYTSGPGRLMVCADYSQAEVRWMAQIANDDKLIRQYKKVVKIHREAARNPTPENALRKDTEGDFHTSNAAVIFKKQPHEVTKNERGVTKNIVFGNIYGMGITLLSRQINRSKKEAKKFQQNFFAQFPEAAAWLEEIEKFGFKHGYVESPLGGRIRHMLSWFLLGRDFNRLRKKGFGNHSKGEGTLMARKAFEDRSSRNSSIQVVASDTNLLASIKINKYIHENNKDWWIVNVVHDSAIADIPFDEVPEYIEVAKQIMEDPGLFKPFKYVAKVPFTVDFSVGYNWGDQIDVSPIKAWKVKCGKKIKGKKGKKEKCGGGKVYGPRPKRCPKCRNKKIEASFDAGPIEIILKKLRKEKSS